MTSSKVFNVPLLTSALLLALTACSNSGSGDSSGLKKTTSAPTKVAASAPTPKSFLTEWDSQISSAGKKAYSGLVKKIDTFTKEGYLNLPESEDSPARLGFQFHSFIYKPDANSNYRPMFEVEYFGSDWKFIDLVYLKFGEDVITLKPFQDPLRKVLGTRVVEFVLFSLTDENVNFLSSIFSAKTLEIRVEGTLADDLKLRPIETIGLKRVLDAYRYMNHEKIQITA